MSEAIKQAGDALTAVAAYPEIRQYIGTVLHDQIREALAALSAEQTKPVAWMVFDGEGGHDLYLAENNEWIAEKAKDPKWGKWYTPLYASPIAAPASQPDAAAIRNKALEEAAKACEGQLVPAAEDEPDSIDHAFNGATMDCIRAIRALATQSEPAQQEPIGYISADTLKKLQDHEWQKLRDEPAALWTVNNPPSRARIPVFVAPTAQQAGQPAQQEMHLEILRRDQADRVMPLIGPLLDAYEGTQKHDLAELYPDLTRYLKAIVRAIDDDAAPVTAERISCPECKGSGSVNLQGDCSDCNGKGYYWELVDAVPSADALKSAAGQPAPAVPEWLPFLKRVAAHLTRHNGSSGYRDGEQKLLDDVRAMINAAAAQEGEKK